MIQQHASAHALATRRPPRLSRPSRSGSRRLMGSSSWVSTQPPPASTQASETASAPAPAPASGSSLPSAFAQRLSAVRALTLETAGKVARYRGSLAEAEAVLTQALALCEVRRRSCCDSARNAGFSRRGSASHRIVHPTTLRLKQWRLSAIPTQMAIATSGYRCSAGHVPCIRVGPTR
eukprot:6174653-Pleurochrysis_carterae.AAC.1